MKKLKIVTGVTSLTDAELSDFSGKIIASLTGNPHFPTPTPSLTILQQLKLDYDDALIKAADGNKSDTAKKNERREGLETALTHLAGYVEMNGQNNESIMLSSGFNIRKPASRGLTPEIPENVLLKDGSFSGEVQVTFSKPANAEFYMVRYTDDLNNPSWKMTDPGSKTKTTIGGLPKGKDVWVQVKAINANGVSDWSDPAVLMVR